MVSTNNHWTYGISVKISHGSGLATIYGHMSARAVNDGDYVTQGQLIGYVGSTGNSTGNHLHFETTLNGAAVSSAVSGAAVGLNSGFGTRARKVRRSYE